MEFLLYLFTCRFVSIPNQNPMTSTLPEDLSKQPEANDQRRDPTAGRITLVLSGGGLRATLFQLGIVLYLQLRGRLGSVRELVSVSGGSILAGHSLLNWQKLLEGPEDFREVAGSLVRIARSDIRNKIFIPWLWSRLAPWNWLRHSSGRSNRLKEEYKQIFGDVPLGQFNKDSYPRFAIVTTDSVRNRRVAFTASEILSWPANSLEMDTPPPTPIKAAGVELSLAVAASSCFPPVFRPYHLTCEELNVTWEEYEDALNLNDGGVLTNLGVEVLVGLRSSVWPEESLVLICDAERMVVKRPKGGVGADFDRIARQLSENARKLAKETFGENCIAIPFSERIAGYDDGNYFRTETNLFGYRTDLDCPTWDEIYALMHHGGLVARQVLSGKLGAVEILSLQTEIANIIEKAHGPANMTPPRYESLKGCNSRPKATVLWHVLGISLAAVLLFLIIWKGSNMVIRWSGIGNNGSGIAPPAGPISQVVPNIPSPVGPLDLEPDPAIVPSLAASGLQRLTDEERKLEGYLESVNRISNLTDSSISLVYNYYAEGHKEENGLTSISVDNIPPRVTLENVRKKFGGPIFLTAYKDGRFYSGKSWFDFGVHRKRDIYVTWDGDSGELRFKVDLVE